MTALTDNRSRYLCAKYFITVINIPTYLTSSRFNKKSFLSFWHNFQPHGFDREDRDHSVINNAEFFGEMASNISMIVFL